MKLRECDRLAGGTFCFNRRLWERTPFRDLSQAVDRAFLEDARVLVSEVIDAPESYIMIRHGKNTWASVDGWYREHTEWRRSIADVMTDPLDREFYAHYADLANGLEVAC